MRAKNVDETDTWPHSLSHCVFLTKFDTFLFQLSGIVGVQIRDMHVPPVVESGKQPHVILDCDYDLTENEGRQVTEWSYLNDVTIFVAL